VCGNYVGSDRTGNHALGNFDGISIEGASKANIIGGTITGKRNIVSGNYRNYGIPDKLSLIEAFCKEKYLFHAFTQGKTFIYF